MVYLSRSYLALPMSLVSVLAGRVAESGHSLENDAVVLRIVFSPFLMEVWDLLVSLVN